MIKMIVSQENLKVKVSAKASLQNGQTILTLVIPQTCVSLLVWVEK